MCSGTSPLCGVVGQVLSINYCCRLLYGTSRQQSRTYRENTMNLQTHLILRYSRIMSPPMYHLCIFLTLNGRSTFLTIECKAGLILVYVALVYGGVPRRYCTCTAVMEAAIQMTVGFIGFPLALVFRYLSISATIQYSTE